jgi:uncharacterized protein
MTSKTALIIFAKAPKAGEVKTRLAKKFGSDTAVRLARCFLCDTWDALWAYFEQGGPRPYVATTGLLDDSYNIPPSAIWQQGHGSLDERLEKMARRALEKHTAVLCIGADSPALPRRLIDSAVKALDKTEAVIGPAKDGGFYLLGLRRCPKGLLSNIAWSTSSTASQTKARLHVFDMPPAQLETWFDIDRPEDLQELHRAIEDGLINAPRTAKLLGEIKL